MKHSEAFFKCILPQKNTALSQELESEAYLHCFM